MRRVLAAAVILACFVAPVVHAADPMLTNEEQKVVYALGLAMARSANNFSLTEAELELVKLGLTDGVLKHPQS